MGSASGQIEWKTLIRDCTQKKKCVIEYTKDHPLKSLVVTDRIPRRILGSLPSTGRTTPVSTPSSITEPLAQALRALDPLTELALRDEMDPLSKMAAEMDMLDSAHPKTISSKAQKEDSFHPKMEPWSSRKAAILSKYTTSEKLSMVTSFLAEGEKGWPLLTGTLKKLNILKLKNCENPGIEKLVDNVRELASETWKVIAQVGLVIVKAQSVPVDKVQHRLEQLDCFDEGSRKLDLSQAEYLKRIDQLNKELVLAWNTEQRVRALKIAIQCAKMLSDTEVLPFYPSKFVLVTDMLDVFGKLVYERLKSKAEYYKPGSKVSTPLPDDFTPDMVCDGAKETCLNWFYKIASIRELVPRLYVEMALLRSYYFISSFECPEALMRMTEMIQGIGNPLVAVYARCYLCKVGLEILGPKCDVNFLLKNFECFLGAYQHIFSRGVSLELHEQKLLWPQYMTLYTPALDFMMEAVACHSPESVLSELLNKCRKYSNSSLIINTIMSGFKPAYISERACQFLAMINHCDQNGLPSHTLLRTLGLCVSVCPPPSEQRRQVLAEVWKKVSTMADAEAYMSCVEVWAPYVAQYFSHSELNLVFGDIINHMNSKRNYEKHSNELKVIIQKVVSHITDLESLLALENLLPLIDLFHDESTKVEVCKCILTSGTPNQTTTDPVIANSLIFLGGILHDSVNALTPEDELRQIGDILCNIVRRINYGKDFEQQLDFYVEARGAFANIDAVLSQLVQCVNTLAITTGQLVKGNHTRKTGDFVRACAAYCFITVPSIVCPKTRLKLYLLSGQVALFNHCLGQADACFKACLAVIQELEPSSETEACLVPFVRQFLSTLIVVPDNPERGVLSLTRMLLNILRIYEWNQQNGALGSLYVSVIDMLAIMAQEEYPYHVDRIESNDSLYGSDPKFIQEIDGMISLVIGEILTVLKEMGSCRKQVQLAADLFFKVSNRGDLNTDSVKILAFNLWNLCVRSSCCDLKYMVSLREYLLRKLKSTKDQDPGLKQLVEKLYDL